MPTPGPARVGRRRDHRRRRRTRSPTRNDVSTEVGARAIIDAAVDEFGRVDIVVNNAGIIRWGDLPDADLAERCSARSTCT